jgi:adenylate kinase
VDNKCDVDGSELIQRVDDQQEMVKERLRSFEAETRPILTRFKEMGNLVEVNGNRSAEEVTADISKELQESLSDLLPA